MKNLLIIGARGFGREVYNTALEGIGYGEEYIIKGFLDDEFGALDGYEGYPPIIDSVENYKIETDDVFICALGDVHYKKKYVDLVIERGGEFISIIHKTAVIERNTQIGKGCVLSRNVQISCDCKIGDYVTMNFMAVVGHDAVIGNYSHLNSMSFMGGYSELKEFVTMHTGAILQPRKKIGKNSVAGAGSFIYKNIKDNTTVFGNPAQELQF